MSGISDLTNNTQQAYLTGDLLNSFVSGLSSQNKLDSLDVTLLAKLHADEHDFFTDRDGWYSSYKEIFQNLNFDIQEFTFREIEIQEDIKIFENMRNAFSSFASLGSEEIDVTNDAILSLGPSTNPDLCRNVWEPSANHPSKQYGSCKILTTSLEQDIIVIKQSFFHLTSSNFNLDVDFLWKYNEEANVSIITIAVLVVRIAIEDYVNIRNDVDQRVADEHNYINQVPLAHPTAVPPSI